MGTERLRGRLAPRITGTSTTEFWLLAATVAVLSGLGLVMTFSASFVESTAQTGDAFGIFRQQLLAFLVGVPLLVGAAAADYGWWRRLAVPVGLVALAGIAVVLVPGIGVAAHGARRWIDLGVLTFQPTELLKFAVPCFVAAVVARRWRRVRGGDLHALLMPALPLLAVAAGLVMAQPDLETTVLVLATAGLVLAVAGLPARLVASGLGATATLALGAIVTTDFRQARITAWLNPLAEPGAAGYQTVQGFIALGSGGVFGRGLGQGRGQWLYIPNAHTDFIYAIIGEELGLVGALTVLGLYALLAVVGIRTARRAPDPFGRLFAAGLTGWLTMQAGMNMGSVVGLLPVTGVTLPLVSFGGSSLIMTMLALGVLMSIARNARELRAGQTGGEPAADGGRAGRRRRGEPQPAGRDA